MFTEMSVLTNRRSVMTLYANEADLIGHCVRLVLMEKDINVEIHFIDEETRPAHQIQPKITYRHQSD